MTLGRFLHLNLVLVGLAAAIVGGGSLVVAQETPETVTVQGRVINGTAGASVAPGLPVMFYSFDQIVSPVLTIEAATGEEGRFQFSEAKLGEGRSYAVVTEYGGVRYSSLLTREDLDHPVELTVYETTPDISVIQVRSQSLIIADINEKKRSIAALAVLNLSNTSDRTLLPDLSNITSPSQISFLRFSLPPQASQLDVQSDLLGGDIIPIGTGFAVTSPVKPGDHSINLTFQFPYEGDRVSFRDSLLQGAKVYRILVPEQLDQLQVAPLERLPDIEIGGSAYRVWESRDFAPGQGLMVELSGLPQPGFFIRLEQSLGDGSFWQVSIPSLLGLVLALALLYGGFRAPRVPRAAASSAASSAGASPVPIPDSSVRRDSLVQAIAALDQRFEQGEVPEGEYRARRGELKQRVQEESGPT